MSWVIESGKKHAAASPMRATRQRDTKSPNPLRSPPNSLIPKQSQKSLVPFTKTAHHGLMAVVQTANDSSSGVAIESRLTAQSLRFRRLIEEALEGEPEARNEMIRTLVGYLNLVARQELDPKIHAKVGVSDIVQSTLLRVEKNLDQFEGHSRAKLLSWVRKILRNRIHEAHRHYQQTEKRNVRREVSATDSKTGVVLTDAHPSPQTEAVLQEEALALRQAIARLPNDYRTIIMLRNWERLPFEEIGHRMNRSTDASKKLWARAIQRLQKELNGDA